MGHSYWERVAQAFRDTPPSKLRALSEEMYHNLERRLKREGWFDTDDISNCLVTAFSCGEIVAFGVQPISEGAATLEAALSDHDIQSISRALYLDMERCASRKGAIDRQDVSTSIEKIFGAYEESVAA